MVRKILWTDTAKMSLKLIFDYHKKNTNSSVANKIRRQIFNDVKLLRTGLFLSTKEPLLLDFEKEYRYLVSRNYKIIYFVDADNIIISLIFDTRQSPQKLYSIIKKQNI